MDYMRSAVHWARSSKETALDHYKMWKNYKRNGKFSNVNEFEYVLPIKLKSSLEQIKVLNVSKKNIFNSPPKITFISSTMPRFTESSDGFRIYNILKILIDNQCKIDYYYFRKYWNDTKIESRFNGKVTFNYLPLENKNWENILTDLNPDYVWITCLWSIRYFRFIIGLITEEKKNNPKYNFIIDTMDFHYKEFVRKYEMTKNDDDMRTAQTYLECEQKLYPLGDCIVVVSEEEVKDIKKKIDGIKDFSIIPNIHDINNFTPSYDKRKNICFVGNFETKHNVDAVNFFIEDIFPNILQKNPSVEFHILGFGSEKYKNHFKSSNVKTIGSIKNLTEALMHYRLFVCPLTYGAGVKGKIGSAIEAGLPIVTTSVGAEGLPLRDGIEYFIADTSEEFAEKCNRCLMDIDLWHRFSIQARLVMAQNFSPQFISKKLKQMLIN